MKKSTIWQTLRKLGFGLPLINSLWLYIFAGYGGAFAFWRLISPQGFPFGHPQFWANSGFPLIVVVVALLGCLALLRSRDRFAKSVALFFLGLTSSAFISSLILFPISLGLSNGLRFLFFFLVVGGWSFLLLLLTVWLFRADRKKTVRKRAVIQSLIAASAVLSAILSVVMGVGVVRSQQSLPAATLPLNETIPPAFNTLSPSDQIFQEGISFKETANIWPESGMVQAQCGTLGLQIHPLLTFSSKSPDRFWTIFAPHEEQRSPRRYLSDYTLTDEQLLFGYVDEDRSWLTLRSGGQGGGQGPLEIEGYSRLPEPIYSHLNTYARLIIDGGERLAISFAATGDVPVEFREAGYPFGKPARMAYLDESGRLAVVEASNAEKGPFRSLAEGPLDRAEAVVFTLYNNGIPQCSVSLEDWAAQASRQLSPTAGWGFTENAIGFQLIPVDRYDDALPTGFMHISLASTSTGRGFDSVGHAAGLYRNRMQITPLNTGLE